MDAGGTVAFSVIHGKTRDSHGPNSLRFCLRVKVRDSNCHHLMKTVIRKSVHTVGADER